MASSSSLPPFAHTKRFHVFPSFHGPDVRKGFLSHVHNCFGIKGITTFKDQEIQRGHSIGPELVNAIRDSRVSIVLLSKNYASSSWCLDELVEILKCKEDSGQMVMTVFYNVDPSSVRKQKGDFGKAFKRTCQGKTEEVKERWSKALTHVANIEGEDSRNWTNEADMIQKIATDVSNKLNLSLSTDFDDMVGMQVHLRRVYSLLCLECDDVKMIGIWGPAGIGKTTIARALFTQLSSHFPLSCFMGNLKGSYKSIGVDDYQSLLDFQNQLLSRILNQKDMKVHHLGAVKERLHDQRVLIILDDVDDIEKLDILAKDTSWFGNGSRIIVTSEDQQIFKAHGIKDIYHVDFPSRNEALEMLCQSAFKQRSVPDGFEEVARKVAELCGNLPLALSVVGASLRGKSKDEWELQISSIDSSLDGKIGNILRVGYDRLSKKDKALFLHMACLGYNGFHDVTRFLADSHLDVENGLQTLLDRSLVQTTTFGNGIWMHSLLEQMGREIVREQSNEPGKRQFLVEAQEILDVLADKTGTGSVIGISANMSDVGEFSISGRAFEGMPNLRFLKLYGSELQPRISEELEYLPRRLRLLVWHNYPRKRLPPTFQPECLVELHMGSSNLEKLWDGIKPLPNLELLDLSDSAKLKEMPDLSEATNLRCLTLDGCISLKELPSYIGNLHKLITLDMSGCEKLRVIPTNINLASLENVDMSYCSQLTTFPDFSRNIKIIKASKTKIEDVPASVAGGWSRLDTLEIGSTSLTKLTKLDLSSCDIKNIPDCVIGLPGLEILNVQDCSKLVSLQSLPPSLLYLYANNCGLLKSVSVSYDCTCVKDAKRVSSSITFYHPKRRVFLNNCWSLSEEARRVIIQRWAYMSVCLPGKQVPAYFTHKTKGNSISISPGTFSASSRFKACVLLTPSGQFSFNTQVVCHLKSKGVLINELEYTSCWHEVDTSDSKILTEHLFVFSGSLFGAHSCVEVDATTSEILFEFSCNVNDEKIIECGVQILTEEGESSTSKWKVQSEEAAEVSKDESVVKRSKHTGFAISVRFMLMFISVFVFFVSIRLVVYPYIFK